MRFSQRIGKVKATKLIQLESIDEQLRNGLWNSVKITILDKLEKRNSYGEPKFTTFCVNLWHNFYKLPIDTLTEYSFENEAFIRKSFFENEWYVVYDFLEFVANVKMVEDKSRLFKEICNSVLEKEFSAYRFVDNLIAPITNKYEIQEIEEVIKQTGQWSSFKGANIHLQSSLEKLSDKKTPDYRNSIKESISAIETVAKVISANEKDSLGGALDKIKGKIKIHQALEKGFKQLYGYTSDSDGIRHSLMDDPNCDFEDAKYMLVSCSAFINYLISKATKAGINLN